MKTTVIYTLLSNAGFLNKSSHFWSKGLNFSYTVKKKEKLGYLKIFKLTKLTIYLNLPNFLFLYPNQGFLDLKLFFLFGCPQVWPVIIGVYKKKQQT